MCAVVTGVQTCALPIYAAPRFRDVASLSVDWIWETDADLAYTFMSDRVERVTGLPPSGYIGQSRIVMFGDPEGDYFLPQPVDDLPDRKRVAGGKSVPVRVDFGGRRYIKKNNHKTLTHT